MALNLALCNSTWCAFVIIVAGGKLAEDVQLKSMNYQTAVQE